MHLGNLDPRMALNTNDTYIAGIPACTFVCPSACMDAWAVWMYGLYGSVDVWMYGWMMDGWVVGWMGGWMHAWLDGGMDGWMDAWMDVVYISQQDLEVCPGSKKTSGQVQVTIQSR